MRMHTGIAIAGVMVAQPALSQRITRVDATPVIGAAVFLRELPDSFQVDASNGPANVLRGVGLNDAPVIGGHLTVWLSSSFALEASGAFMPSGLHGDAGQVSVDVSAFTLGGRVLAPGARRLRPYLGLGFGAKRYDFKGDVTGTATHFAGSISGSALAALAPDIRLRVEARDCISVFASETAAPSRRQHDLLFTVGVDLALIRRGGTAKPQPTLHATAFHP